MNNRQSALEALQQDPSLDVLVIGGGVNGIGTFRDLALQGLRVLLVERDDFGAGASAASSHMLHGGVRYLENGEFRLVREALHERNLMLINAPHYAKPLPTTIPMFRWFSGLLNAPLKFVRLLERPAERGAVVIKIGLIFYDLFTGAYQTMPKHKFAMRDASLKKYPRLNPKIICTATYYDGFMPYPERICLEMVMDAERIAAEAMALNYVSAVGGEGDAVILRDELTGENLQVKPKIVVNAAGPWIDFVNGALGENTRFIGGTKGSHLVLDYPELREAIGETEMFFENDDGRIVLILPYLDKVMIGTTDIRIDDPDKAVCTEDEIDYMINLVERIFPTLPVTREHIVFQFSGVRPLPASDANRTGQISRDHSIRVVEPDGDVAYPVLSLVGGKWTTFRAFAEQTTDAVLQRLGKPRQASTDKMPIGGGRDYPTGEVARKQWLGDLQMRTGLELHHLQLLFDRYGTYAAQVADYIREGKDAPLSYAPDFTRREIAFISENEKVGRLSDVLLRRTLVAMLGLLHQNRPLLEEIAAIVGEAQGWSQERIQEEIADSEKLLAEKYGTSLEPVKVES